MIWRRFWVSGNTSLADFHHITSISYLWERLWN
jgi:hypothetical protein